MKCIVIGAGSVGTHIAYRLQKLGTEVVLLDATRPAKGTSSASFAWLSSFPQLGWDEEPGKTALRKKNRFRFHDLVEEVGGDWLHVDGTLAWGTTEERSKMRSLMETCTERGVDLELLNADEVQKLFPGIVVSPDDEFIYEPQSGWVDAPALIEHLIEAFIALGGEVSFSNPVTGFVLDDQEIKGVHTASGEEILGDLVINAAGSWGTHIAAMAGAAIPLNLLPGLMIYTNPIPASDVRRPVLNSPLWLARGNSNGGLAIHWRGGAMEAGHDGNAWSATRVLEQISETLPFLADIGVSSTRIGVRPVPPGGPIVGSLPWQRGLYHVLSHGGIGWGPVWADLISKEILEQDVLPELGAFRPERFFFGTDEFGRFPDNSEQLNLFHS